MTTFAGFATPPRFSHETFILPYHRAPRCDDKVDEHVRWRLNPCRFLEFFPIIRRLPGRQRF